MKVIHGIVRLQTTPKKLRPKTKAAQSEARLKWLYTWSPSMPLLTPARRKGSPAPMLKEANYSQYLPHSGEARSCRGQACETFLQPAAAAHLPPCSLVLLFFGSILPQPLFLPLSSVSLWIALVSLFFSPAWWVFSCRLLFWYALSGFEQTLLQRKEMDLLVKWTVVTTFCLNLFFFLCIYLHFHATKTKYLTKDLIIGK